MTCEPDKCYDPKERERNRECRHSPFYIEKGPMIRSVCEVNTVELAVCWGRRQWHPTPVFLPGKSHGWRIHGVTKSRTRLMWLGSGGSSSCVLGLGLGKMARAHVNGPWTLVLCYELSQLKYQTSSCSVQSFWKEL